MKTFKHKVADVLATLTEKTVWMSDLQGHIYKQFPIQHLNPDQFEDTTTEFPGDFDAERMAFTQRRLSKVEEKKRAAETARLAAYEKRKAEVLNRWRVRKAMQNGLPVWSVMVAERKCTGNGDSEYVCNADGFPRFFTSEQEYLACIDEERNARVDHGYENEISYGKVNVTDWLEWVNDYEEGNYEWFAAVDYKDEIVEAHYDSIVGCVIIAWSWKTYVGYCRKLGSVFLVDEGDREFQTERDLITGNEERTFYTNYDILLTKEEVDACNQSSQSLDEKVLEELNQSKWKWEHYAHYNEEDLKYLWNR